MKNTEKYTREIQENLVEIITEYKSTNVIVGGKIFMSIDDAKSIIKLAGRHDLDQEAYMSILEQSKDLLVRFAEAIMFANENEAPTPIHEILRKY